MKRSPMSWLVLIGLLFVSFGATASQDQPAAPAAPRPIGLQDILAWKAIGSAELSADGGWFMYRLTPLEGEGEAVIRQTRGDRELRFPIGEAPRFGGPAGAGFSSDAKWAAFLSYPGSKEMKALRKERKRVMTTAVLVDLATGEKTEFEKVRSLAFSGENPRFVALHRYAPESQEKEKDKWTGTDLVLRELASGKEINIGNVAEFAFDRDGKKLAMLIDAQGQAANGLLIRDMASGAVLPLDNDKASYKSLTWTEKGEALAVLKGKEDKGYEDKLWSVVAFSGLQNPKGPQKIVYDPAADKDFPEGLTVSPNRAPVWTESFDGLLFGIHEVKKKKDAAKKDESGREGEKEADPAPAPKPDDLADEDIPDLVIWHGKDGRLQSMQQVQEQRDKTFSYLSIYRVKEKTFLRLADDDLRQVQPAPKHRFAVGQDSRAYELDANLDGRRFQDIYVVDLATGARRLALEKCRYFYGPLYDGTRLLYYQDKHFHTYDMATGRSVNITKDVPASFVNEDDDHNVVDPPDYPVGSALDGLNVLLSDGWDIWSVPAAGGGKGVNLTANGYRDKIRYRRLRIDPEEKAIDLGRPQYVSAYGEWTKKAGLARIEKGKPAPAMLLWDDAGFGGLAKAKKAEVYVYTRDTFKDYPDYYVTDALLRDGRRITEANPQQKDFLWSSGRMLIDYTSAKGDKLQAALFLPPNYEKGKSYPTLVYYYEKMSQQLNRYTQPSANGFNKSVYTSNGYAVLMPDITYKINDPGMSAAWCVLPAIDAAVATGIVDRSKVGLQGHSWGGYQTSFLITQADFAAAVAGAPLTNMISMYSSIYFNTGSANQPIFESSQGRFTGGYWDNLEAYQRNSPVYYAERVNTPLIILHNDKDGAVDWNQGIEYYNTLRRLKKPVIMLQYVGENHGLRKPANQKDYTVRMKEFFDHHLMGKPAPAWVTDGVPHLDLKDHLKERAKDLRPAAKPAVKEPGRK
jgi:dipeptidyl aminopeptidase/acylaminoacyl peptidase